MRCGWTRSSVRGCGSTAGTRSRPSAGGSEVTRRPMYSRTSKKQRSSRLIFRLQPASASRTHSACSCRRAVMAAFSTSNVCSSSFATDADSGSSGCGGAGSCKGFKSVGRQEQVMVK
eukprot:711932-Rhodomonas_salina.3